MVSNDLKRITGNPEIATVAQSDRRTGARPHDHAAAAWPRAKTSSRPTRPCWPSMAPSCSTPPAAPIGRSPSRRPWRRNSDHRQYQSMPGGQPDSVDPRHPQRHLQFHSHANGRPRRRAMPPPWPKPSSAATPKPIRRWTSMAPTPCKSWRSWRIWRSAFGRNGATSPAAASTRSMRPICGMPRSWAIGFGCWRWRELGAAGLDLHVSPTLVHTRTPLAEVRGAFNAVNLVGDAVGPLFFHGLGAGQMPTASAVVADLIDMVVGRAAITFRTLRLWADEPSHVRLADPAHSSGRYYLRFNVADRPGVLAEIAGELGPARNFDRLGDPAHARWHRRHRAAGDHDPRRPRKARCEPRSKRSIACSTSGHRVRGCECMEARGRDEGDGLGRRATRSPQVSHRIVGWQRRLRFAIDRHLRSPSNERNAPL